MTPASGAAAIALCLMIARAGAEAQTTPRADEPEGQLSIALFDDLAKHWIGERVQVDSTRRVVSDALPELAGGTLKLTPGFGWTRTRDVYSDFRLEFEFRGNAGDAFIVYFRTWPALDKAGAPVDAHRATLGIVDGEWHSVEVECRGDRANIRVDGKPGVTHFFLRNPTGYLGLRGSSGTVELRRATLTPFRGTTRLLAGPRSSDDTTIQLPRVRRDVKPQYTREAMRQRIEGTVLMELLVGEDGRVRDVALLRSLDPVFGLDAAALKAATQWRFQPASKDGKPVPLIVTIEMQFTLK